MSYNKRPNLGQATMANSEPVVLASDQTAIPVSATDLDIRPLVNTDVVTAELSATDNAVLDAIAASVDGVETLLGTIDADTGAILAAVDGLEASNAAIQTAVETIDNAISGTEMQVDVVAPLPAGTNNIGDVDVLSMPGIVVEDAAETAGGNLMAVGTVRRDTAASSAGTTGDNATLNTDSVGALWTRDTASQVDDAAFTPATGRILPIGFLADETATDSVDEGDAGIARMTLDRKQVVTPYVHAAAGGWTPYKNIDVDESEDQIKATAGKLGWIHVMNMSASVRYLKLYNATAASVTVGTTVPDHTFPIPTFASTNGAGFVISFGDAGQQFSTAITVAATTGLADNDTGAPGADEVIINLGFL